MIHYHYTDKELNNILKTLTIIIDSREKENQHIRDYLFQKIYQLKTKN